MCKVIAGYEPKFEEKFEELNDIINQRLKKQELLKKISILWSKIESNFKKFTDLSEKMPL